MEAYAPTRPRFLVLQVLGIVALIVASAIWDLNWAFPVGMLIAVPLIEFRKYRVRKNAKRFLEKSEAS